MNNSGQTLKDLCELIVDCEHKTAPLSSEGYPSIRTPNVGRGRLLLEAVNRVDEETYMAWTRRAEPRENDLIIAREAPVGNVAIIRPGQKVCLGQRTVLVRPDPELVDPEYLTYFLLGDYAQSRFRSVSLGSTVAHLNMSDIRGLPIPKLPSIFQQRRIAAVLSAYDDLIENNARRITILEDMARRLFEEWFGRFCGPTVGANKPELPQGWVLATLQDWVDELRESVDPKAISPETPYVGLEHLSRRSTTLTEFGRADQVGSTKLRFARGDILFGKIRPYFHKVALAPFAGVSSSDAIVIRPKSPRELPMALAVTSNDGFVAHATQTSNGTKMPRADWKVLRSYLVPIPPKEMLNRFNAAAEPWLWLSAKLGGSNANLRTTRDFLLPKLISGEIEVGAAEQQLEAVAA